MGYIPNVSRKVQYAGIEWTESYNTYRSVVAGWLYLTFSWKTDEGYVISVADTRINVRRTDPEHAASVAVAAARKLLARAAEALTGAPATQPVQQEPQG